MLSPNQEVHIAYGDRHIISQNRHDLAALIYNCLHADSIKSQYSFEFMKETTEAAIPYNAQEKEKLFIAEEEKEREGGRRRRRKRKASKTFVTSPRA